jgi:hypothetical protein
LGPIPNPQSPIPKNKKSIGLDYENYINFIKLINLVITITKKVKKSVHDFLISLSRYTKSIIWSSKWMSPS